MRLGASHEAKWGNQTHLLAGPPQTSTLQTAPLTTSRPWPPAARTTAPPAGGWPWPYCLLWWPVLEAGGMALATGCFLFGGLWLSPDLDTRSRALKRWGPLGLLW